MPASRRFDLVLFGATGFTGGLTAEYLARHAPASARWALAGRSRSRLEAVRGRLAAIAPACANLELLEAEVGDPASLRRVAEASRVVITTVGPYIIHGAPLVAACAAAGTDYLDLTGEPEFVDRMWLEHHETAVRSGARLIHCAGFDSIPHDLGAYFTVQQLPAGAPIRLEGFVRAGGTFSAGTYHSAVHAFSRLGLARRAAAERRAREARPAGRRVASLPARIHYETALRAWAVPFPSVDPLVVRRSAAALDRYGPDFAYAHYILVKKAGSVAGLLGGVSALVALAQLPPTRKWLLSRKSSGEGPSEAQRAKAWFQVRFRGESGGRTVETEVAGGDPGYGETSKMLAESGLCLAFDALPKVSGQTTPAVAMGDALLGRLQRAGIRFTVTSGDAAQAKAA